MPIRRISAGDRSIKRSSLLPHGSWSKQLAGHRRPSESPVSMRAQWSPKTPPRTTRVRSLPTGFGPNRRSSQLGVRRIRGSRRSARGADRRKTLEIAALEQIGSWDRASTRRRVSRSVLFARHARAANGRHNACSHVFAIGRSDPTGQRRKRPGGRAETAHISGRTMS